MKIYLDDERKAPKGWHQTDFVSVCTKLLALNKIPSDTLKKFNKSFDTELGHVTHLSLDHDLGKVENGYDVLLWIEEEVFTGEYFILPKITIHTANVSARKKMELALARIQLEIKEKEDGHTIIGTTVSNL